MKKLHCLLFLSLIALAVSCRKDEPQRPAHPPVIVLASDHGKVKLTYGSSTLTAEGACTFEVVNGRPTITVRDSVFDQRIFTIVLTDYVVPIISATYPLTESGIWMPAPGTAYAVFEDLTANPAGQWMSDNNSGTITFSVEGAEAICIVDNLPLQPTSAINTGSSAVVGHVSGKFKFDVQ